MLVSATHARECGADAHRACEAIVRLQQLLPQIGRQLLHAQELVDDRQCRCRCVRVDEGVEPRGHEEDAAVLLHPLDLFQGASEVRQRQFALSRPVEPREAVLGPLLRRRVALEAGGPISITDSTTSFNTLACAASVLLMSVGAVQAEPTGFETPEAAVAAVIAAA